MEHLQREFFCSRAACYHLFLSFFFRFPPLSLSLSIFAFSIRQTVPTSLLFIPDSLFQSIKKKPVFSFFFRLYRYTFRNFAF